MTHTYIQDRGDTESIKSEPKQKTSERLPDSACRGPENRNHTRTLGHTLAHACTILNQNLIRITLKKRLVEQLQYRVGQGGEGTKEHRQTHTCARKHTQTDISVHRYTHTLLCVWPRRHLSVCARSHVSADLCPCASSTHTCKQARRLHADPSHVVRTEMA